MFEFEDILAITLIVAIFGSFILYVFWFMIKEIKKDIKKDITLKDFYTLDLSLIKTNRKKRKNLYVCFNKRNECKLILILKKGYLQKDKIPAEFLIERNPKKAYYNYLKSLLKINGKYKVCYGKTETNKLYIMSAIELE
jgi:hypothetical protein